MRTITICNQKGGCGKTATAFAMAAGLNRRGFRVLAVDTDGQHSLTMICGALPGPTLSDVIAGRATAAATIQKTAQGFDLLPGDLALPDLPKRYKPDTLRGILAGIRGKYDFCVIDTPPALGIMTTSTLAAASDVVLTAAPDILSLYGIEQAAGAIDSVRPITGPLRVGILLTQYSERRTVDRTMKETIQAQARTMGAFVYRQTIRAGVAVPEAHLLRQDIFTSAPRAGVTADYNAFIDEFLKGV